MSTTRRRTARPAKIAELGALALRIEVNILKNGQSYTTVVDMTRGQGVPIEAVPEGLSSQAVEASLRALFTTPGLLPQVPTLAVIASGKADSPFTLVNFGASHAEIVQITHELVKALEDLQARHAMEHAHENADSANRRELH